MLMRRTTVAAVAALALWTWAVAAQDAGMADMDDFALETGEDLADLCSAKQGDPLYADATMFCYGVIEGMIQYHDAVGKGPAGDFIVCPEGTVSRTDMVEIFVGWAKANPQKAANDWPADAVVEAALAEWGPCLR
jgi:hypothetical protein